jgi:hypothetical protein
MTQRWYSIRVAGCLGPTALGAFPDFESDVVGSDTTLSAELNDASALYGALGRLEALGLEVVDLHRLNGPPGDQKASSGCAKPAP